MTVIVLALTLFSLCFTTAAHADGKSATLFYDGAVVERDATASRGVLELPLPAGFVDNSLRIRPVGNTVIRRVEQLPPRRDGKGNRELDALTEQKNRLEDRLKALDVREQIFTSSAKSQSGKAPRKTKANPDPMQSIRQGTDFAIAQLEAVYTARRKTMQELKRVEARMAALGKSALPEGASLLRVQLSPANGKVSLRYALSGSGWTPRYDLHLDNSGSARLVLHGQAPVGFDGYMLRFSPSTVAGPSIPLFSTAPSPGQLAEYRLPASDLWIGPGVTSDVSVTLANTSAVSFPAGEATLFHDREYLGRALFSGMSSGKRGVFSLKK